MSTRDRRPWSRYRTEQELPVSFEQLEPRLLLNGTLPVFEPLDPYGSLIYWTQAADEIESSGDADDHTFVIEGAQTATVLIYPDSALRAEVKIVHGLSQLGIAQGSEAGENVVLSGVALDEAGTYKILLTGLDETFGTYKIEVYLGAVVDSEVYGGESNSTFATAQDIDASFLSVDSEARRGAVLGSLPVVLDDFETGLLDSGTWEIPSSQGRTEVTDAHTAAGGDYSLWMDLMGGGADALNEAIWTVDLSGLAGANLHFSHAEYNDDETAFAGPFVGQHNADGVAISADGINWHPIWDATDQPEGEWQTYTIDLAAEAAAAGITFGADFKIKFQQYDDGEIPSASRGWDDVNITRYGSSDSEDWYVFRPTEAGEITLVLVSPYTDDVEIELYSAGEELLAQSTSLVGANVAQILTDFTVVPEDYYIRVTGHATYNLVVLTKSTFDILPNNEPALAQNISAAPTVLGAIYGGESHFYRFWMSDAGDISIKTLTPMGDSLDPAIVLYDEAWTPLAEDDNSATDMRNAALTYAGSGPGMYFVELYSAGGTGEFVLDVGLTSNLPSFVPAAPLGSLVYWTEGFDEIETVGDTDGFTFDVDGPVFVSASVSPDSALQPKVRLFRGSSELDFAAAELPGQNAIISGVQLTEAGTYTLVVSGLEGTTGVYGVFVFQRAAEELDAEGGADNGTLQTAQNIDDSFIDLTDTARRAAVLGYLPSLSEDFEDGSLGLDWATSSSDGAGRIEVTDAHAVGGGEYSLWMDRSDSKGYTLNEAVWTVDLSDLADAFLHFSHAEYGDDEHAFDGAFTNAANADGVAISADGITWYPVWDAVDQPYVEWEQYMIDLVQEAADAGIMIGPNFQIKFQQYDDGSISSGGRGWDDIYISSDITADNEDWYSFTTSEVGTFAVVAARQGGEGVELELYLDVDVLLAEGRPVGVGSEVISDFSGPAGEYYLRVAGAGYYNLLVLTESTFNTEQNISLDAAQNITPTGVVLGWLEPGEGSFYEFAVNEGDELTIETLTPLGDELDPAIELYGPDDQPITVDENSAADGRNALLVYTDTITGTYKVEVYPTAGTGEYVLDVSGHTGEPAAFEVSSTDPADATRLSAAPSQITVDFSDSVNATTLDAEDLTVDGVPATDVTLEDHDTAVFDLPEIYGEGFVVVSIETGAIKSIHDAAIEEYSGTFKIGSLPPKVVYSSIQEAKTLPTGDLTYTVRFSEPLGGANLDKSDIKLVDSAGTPYEPINDEGFEYDDETWTLTLKYSDLLADAYTLTLLSGGGQFEDLVGDDLDGETDYWPIPSYTSGNGVASGDFVVHFALQDLSVGRPNVLSFGGGAPATYYDADGDLVTIRLVGPGQGTVSFTDEGPHQMDGNVVELLGTTGGSSLWITTADRDTKTSIMTVYAHGPLGGIHAGTTDLRLSIFIEGGLQRLVLADLPGSAEHTVMLNTDKGPLPPALRLWATFDEVANCKLDTGGIPISKLTAAQWDDGEVIAPWARNIRITGDSRYGIPGDFGADITLDSVDKNGYSLWWLKVNGKITDSNIDASSGMIKSLSADQWDSGSISGRTLQRLLIRGDKKDDRITGAFGADLNLTWDFISKNTFGNCRIAGPIVGGTWSIRGTVPVIRAAYIGPDWALSVSGTVKLIDAPGGIGGTISGSFIKRIKTKGVLSAQITINSFDRNNVSLYSLHAGLVDGAVISAAGRINSIRVQEWTDGRISALRVGSLRVTGNRKGGLAGDFSADLALRGSTAKGRDLGTVVIAGDLGSDDPSMVSWSIDGTAGNVRVKGNVWGWTVVAQKSINSIKVASLNDSEVTAEWIGSVKTTGDFVRDELELTGSKHGGVALGRVSVSGKVVDSNVKATSGAIGRVGVGQWESGSLEAPSIRSISTRTNRKRPAITGDFNATVDVLGGIGGVKVAGDLTGTWSARSIRSIAVGGSLTDADITLTQTPHRSYKALGSLSVSGWIDSSSIVSAGNIGKVIAGGMRETSIFAGVAEYEDIVGVGDEPDSVYDLPVSEDDFYLLGPAGASIDKFTITGKVKSGGFSLINSNIAAAQMVKVYACWAKEDNDGVPFGFAAGSIKNFTYEDASGKVVYKDLDVPVHSLIWTDMAVRLL